MKHRFRPHAAALLLLILGCLLLQNAARAVLVGAGSVEMLVRSSDVILKARVVATEKAPFEFLSFTLEPIGTLKNRDLAIPARIAVTPAAPIWPEEMDFPYRKGAVGVFFLEWDQGRFAVANNLNAILPAVDAPVAPEAGLTPEAKVMTELLPVLKRMKSDRGTSRLLGLLGELATPRNEDLFAPYLKHENEWVRRGALGALLRLTPGAERVEQANADFKLFLKSKRTAQDYRFWQLYRVVEDGSPAFLPIYRSVADAPRGRGFEGAAVRGLRRGGQKEDSLRLYKYARHKDPYLRHEALDGLCRIYKIALKRPEVTSYQGPLPQEAVDQEARMLKAVRAALRKEGLIK